MEITVDIVPLRAAINNQRDQEAFDKFIDGKEFPGGIQVKTYEAWTKSQQGAIHRDIGIVARLLETTPRAVKSILKRAKPTKELFAVKEWVGAKGRGKTIKTEKSFAEFTNEDCREAIPVIREYLSKLINNVYQEIVIIYWSTEENKNRKTVNDISPPDYEFTGKPFVLEEK